MLCSRVVIAENLIFKCSSVFRIFHRRTVIRAISVLQILRVKLRDGGTKRFARRY